MMFRLLVSWDGRASQSSRGLGELGICLCAGCGTVEEQIGIWELGMAGKMPRHERAVN